MNTESEDAFHLTPVDVRRYDFGTAMRGYDRARVDQFRDQVAEELERLTRAVNDLDGKTRSMAEQLKVFRERDKALNEALISAQQIREEMKQQAQREADLMLREAQAKAAEMHDDSRAQMVGLQADIDALDRARRAYLAQLRTLAERHLAEVESLENVPTPGANLHG
jgi:DivIVA domain-containing protein